MDVRLRQPYPGGPDSWAVYRAERITDLYGATAADSGWSSSR